MIGYIEDQIMPSYDFYDLTCQTREDALVLNRLVDDSIYRKSFETFYERLAWSAMLAYGFSNFKNSCKATLTDTNSNVLETLRIEMNKLSFTEPIPTGSFCGIFERDDIKMTCTITPSKDPKKYIFFHVGSKDKATIQKFLTTLTENTSLSIDKTFLEYSRISN